MKFVNIDQKTFPKHLHDGSEERVVESFISDVPEEALRQFLAFVRDKLRELGRMYGE